MELSGTRVLITGGSRGIGAACARAFAAAGAEVALAARSATEIEALANELGGRAYPIDLADRDAIDGFIARVEADGGPIDVLVNNAGIDTSTAFTSLTEDEIEQSIRVNLVAPERLTRQVLPGMLARGRGHIVSVSSLAAVVTGPGLSLYGSTKAGLSHFTANLRNELIGSPIGFTVVQPGPVDTGMWDRVTSNDVFGTAAKRFSRLQMLPHLSPEQLADEIVDAVRTGQRHVRHPKRLTGAQMMTEAPRRISELLLKGVARPHQG